MVVCYLAVSRVSLVSHHVWRDILPLCRHKEAAPFALISRLISRISLLTSRRALRTRTCKSLVSLRIDLRAVRVPLATGNFLELPQEKNKQNFSVPRFLSIATNRQLRTKWLGQPLLGTELRT